MEKTKNISEELMNIVESYGIKWRDTGLLGDLHSLVNEVKGEAVKNIVKNIKTWMVENHVSIHYRVEADGSPKMLFTDFLDTLDGGEEKKPEESERDRIGRGLNQVYVDCIGKPAKGTLHSKLTWDSQADYVIKELLEPLREENKKIELRKLELVTRWRKLREWVEGGKKNTMSPHHASNYHGVLTKMDELENKEEDKIILNLKSKEETLSIKINPILLMKFLIAENKQMEEKLQEKEFGTKEKSFVHLCDSCGFASDDKCPEGIQTFCVASGKVISKKILTCANYSKGGNK